MSGQWLVVSSWPPTVCWRGQRRPSAGRDAAVTNLSRLITSKGGTVDSVADGAQAIAQARVIPYHLILMDMQMPGIDGPAAAAVIISERSDQERLPIIALTANAFEEDRQRCLDAGMCDFISKPVSPALLFSRLNHWLGSSPARV